ncbi:MAG: hypothetical protein Q9163_006254 [Psora crenata]
MYKLSRSRPLAAALGAAKQQTAIVRNSALQQKRFLSIHEYLSANLLKSYGVGVPKGEVARSAAEAEKIAQEIGGDDMVIKAQVLAGGRGKGTFDNGLKGGVRVIYSPTEAKMFADQMIGHKLITKQTGAAGRLCSTVYICERKFARREFYLAILMDRQSQAPVIIASSQGGMDIETVAKESPEAIITTNIDINEGVTDDIARNITTDLGFSEHCIEDAKDMIQKLYKVFMEKDATQIEINPLSETSDHQVLAMDAKLNFDDNAEFRQKEVFAWRDRTQEDADEVKAAESGLNFIKLDGDIGCLVNGAGLAMATMDIIKLNGGSPANFLDVGGGATSQAIKEAFDLITGDPKVTAIFVNIFGGIVRCDAIAQGLISVVRNMDLRTPIVARLQGTNMEKAAKLINESGLKIFSIDDLQSAAEKSVQFSKVVKMAREIDASQAALSPQNRPHREYTIQAFLCSSIALTVQTIPSMDPPHQHQRPPQHRLVVSDRPIHLWISIPDQNLRSIEQSPSLLGIAGSTSLASIIQLVEQSPRFPRGYHVDMESVMVEDNHGEQYSDVVDMLFQLWQQGDTPTLLVTAEKDETELRHTGNQSDTLGTPGYPAGDLTQAALYEAALVSSNSIAQQPHQQVPNSTESPVEDPDATPLSQELVSDTGSQAIVLTFDTPSPISSELSETAASLIEAIQRRLLDLPQDYSLRLSMARVVSDAMNEEEERWRANGLVEPSWNFEGED